MLPSHIRKPHSPIAYIIPVHSPCIQFKPDLASLYWYLAILTLRSKLIVIEGCKLDRRFKLRLLPAAIGQYLGGILRGRLCNSQTVENGFIIHIVYVNRIII